MARKKGKKKRKRRYTRTKRTGKKRHTMGIIGKLGVFNIAVMPLLIALFATLQDTFARVTKQNYSIVSGVYATLIEFVNTQAVGIGFNQPIKEMRISLKDGSQKTINPGAGGLPKGWAYPVYGVGFAQVLADRVVSLVNGNRGSNIPGTHYRAIGNY